MRAKDKFIIFGITFIEQISYHLVAINIFDNFFIISGLFYLFFYFSAITASVEGSEILFDRTIQ